ncbi:serine-threonine protein kinase, putative [Entamoeba invadens IP1]|uniref:serine-threonine protein kinase, putative n=1 Tax=Entamoeba invadens IP1 TaxID=370355 RepID=UPI0002C3D7A2|nr:serine-threonine protein kinase, putative [Entamoeba invadens IP1]ELP93840.1 serine-threonine protein kinase, putative [Entamoeba invadens IP1]|eukprot:XP_004260611.1 serine-threonine protein kinase, putative [Entamoeba invadens IP1]
MPTNLILVSLLYTLTYSFECSSGCKGDCISNYTCNTTCDVGYDQESSCLYCSDDHLQGKDYVYIKNKDTCLFRENLVKKTGWVPDDVQQIEKNIIYSFSFDDSTPVDYGPCFHTDKYRVSKWFKVDMNTFRSEYIQFNLSKNIISDTKVSIDVSNSQRDDPYGTCFGRVSLIGTDLYNKMKLPILFPHVSSERFFYVFISIEGYERIDFKFLVIEDRGYKFIVFKEFNQETTDALKSDLSSKVTVRFPFEEYGLFEYPTCIQNVLMSNMIFAVNFKGNYSLMVDSTRVNKVLYLQEFRFKEDLNGDVVSNMECVQFWNGQKYGVAKKMGNTYGIKVRIESNPTNETRYFSVMTQEFNSNVDVDFKVICPSNCNYELGHGQCQTTFGGCQCEESYGGDDCHLKCYHNGKWQVDEHSNLCQFGSRSCDQYCHCAPGYSLSNELCISTQCISGSIGPNEECIRGSLGCTDNCFCQNGFKSLEGRCISTTCGNGEIDTYTFNGQHIEEECDNGTNCDITCHCVTGFYTLSDNPTSCGKKTLATYVIVLITLACVVAFLVFIGILIVIGMVILRYKEVDIEVFRTQQPEYYHYITGSTLKAPAKDGEYYISPLSLDFGNEHEMTEVLDTRFERFVVKNNSKKKHMLVIFHTPNNPKFVFHFEPQVVVVNPRTERSCVCYMTIYCTTRIRDMKLPYTIWFSESVRTLSAIAELLRDKTFDTWDAHDKEVMSQLYPKVLKHFHYQMSVTTDAASSTHIDLDELNMSERPIAEGAMGKVYFGNYRSVPVAIKQFRWENLDEEEMNELKKSVVAECEIMSKLRNPFIANYMGSVTYIPQVSMVIQFFVLGSLGEYLREDKEDYLRMSYKLKLKILFDTARGMQFLHENRIMHLDLKPDNLLVNSLDPNSACSVKITDFGTSRFTKKTMGMNVDKGLGTPIYAAPEAFKDEYTFGGDVYSFGITAWEIFYQEEPYKDFKSLFDIKIHVESGKRLNINDKMPILYKNMVEGCWKQDTSARLNFEAVIKALVKIDEECTNHQLTSSTEEDEEVIKKTIARRNEKMEALLKDICVD